MGTGAVGFAIKMFCVCVLICVCVLLHVEFTRQYWVSLPSPFLFKTSALSGLELLSETGWPAIPRTLLCLPSLGSQAHTLMLGFSV